MKGKRYSKVLTVLLIIIIIAVIALLAYLGYSYYKKMKTQQDAEDFVGSFTDTDDSSSSDAGTSDENALVDESDTSSSSATKTTYKGFEVLGTIEIPETDVKYPILATLSGKALDTAVVAAYPSPAELNTVGNVVIMGHNYRNGTFFSDNKKLSVGDNIYITDLNGDKVKYVIYDVFQASDTDTSFYNRDTDGKMEITLSTCTDDSSARIIILAAAEETEDAE